MKAATGELNLTVVTIIAIAAIAAFFMGFLWPQIQDSIQTGWEEIEGSGTTYIENIDVA